MMKKRVLSFLIFFAIFDQIESEKGFFTVVASNLFRLGKSYRVSIDYQGYENEKTLEISVKNRIRVDENSVDDERFTVAKNVSFSGSGVKSIDLDLTNLPEQNYVLEVKSVTGDNFTSYKKLNMNHKQFSVFIQTDKSVYKPSDKIQFRVLALNEETRPLDVSNAEIFITDGADNRVKQFEKVEFYKGLYQNELQLSDLPVMGIWKIHVKLNNEKETVKKISVAEYVLPKFEVTIEANPDANFKDGQIQATVSAKYTFGKFAKGNATISAELEGCKTCDCDRIFKRMKISKSVAIDGKKLVEFDINELEITEENYEPTVILSISFVEELSRKESNAMTRVKIHSTKHTIDLKQSRRKFKPGLPFKVTALVRFHDKNMPVSDEHNFLRINITLQNEIVGICQRVRAETTTTAESEVQEFYCQKREFLSEERKFFLKNGVAEINVDIPLSTKFIHIEANYLETKQKLSYIPRVETDPGEYIQAQLLTENPSLNKHVNIEVLSTTEINKLSYQVFGRKKLVESKTLNFNSTKRHVLNITPNISMIPKASIVVYYLTDDGEIISDQIDVGFGNQLANFVDLELSSEQGKPGEMLNITISTRTNSLVGLLGVDQSVLLLEKGNDIEPSSVFWDLEKYGEANVENSKWYPNMEISRINHDFEDSNAILISNTKKRKNREYIWYNESQNNSVKFSALSASDLKKLWKVEPTYEEVIYKEYEYEFERKMTPYEVNSYTSKIQIRKEFPETWLFDNFDFTNGETKKTILKKVPDTITSWIITGIAVDPETGLGITKQPTKFNVFQFFFVSTNLPYSIKQGEVVTIPINIFNYMDIDQEAEVTLFNNEKEFEFVEIKDGGFIHRSEGALDVQRKKKISIKSNDVATISFIIKPFKVGQITIKVIAESQMAGDGVERQLKVEPEGVTQYMNKAVFIDLRKNSSFSTEIDIMIPDNAVPDLTRIEASAVGDVLGTTIENLDKLIKIPYGCGEQNMLNFVPNIVVLDYLTSLNKLNPNLEAKAKKYMESGYQRELTYKHNDGSYSAFGRNDYHGSTWLTAFVVKSFNQASKYILVDKEIVKQGLDFLAQVQTNYGNFPEVGHVSHKDMQGGSSQGIALTAYTLITFLENKDVSKYYRRNIDLATNYIVKNIDQLDDTYSLAIASYALQLANHSSKDSFLTKLDSKSKTKDGMKYWKKESLESENTNSCCHQPNSVDIEMSAYALQAYIEADRDRDAAPIMNWLIAQRNENGGFQSTQDTIVGLQALSKLATKIYVPNSEIEISVKSSNSNSATIKINSANSLVLHKHEMSPDARKFEVTAKGNGFSILQIAYRFNINDSVSYPRFELSAQNVLFQKPNYLEFMVCTSYIADAQTDKSNMAVMEVSLPSGFTFDFDHLPSLMSTDRVKKVETKNDDTIVIVYFDEITTDVLCPDFKAFRTHCVEMPKPSPIVIYDYYDNARQARTFY